MRNKHILIVLSIVAAMAAGAVVVYAGNPNPPGPPEGLQKIGKMRAGVPKTGQTTSYATGDDGDLEMGVEWPSLRFTDNLDGTVTDNLTGLIWLKNGNCPNGGKNWSDALTFASALHDGWTGDPGGGDCSLSDNSVAGDWRLPNVRELYSLIHLGQADSSVWLNTQGFTGVQSYYYWSSTSTAFTTSNAWSVILNFGYVDYDDKPYSYYVWPVRGG